MPRPIAIELKETVDKLIELNLLSEIHRDQAMVNLGSHKKALEALRALALSYSKLANGDKPTDEESVFLDKDAWDEI